MKRKLGLYREGFIKPFLNNYENHVEVYWQNHFHGYTSNLGPRHAYSFVRLKHDAAVAKEARQKVEGYGGPCIPSQPLALGSRA